MNITNKSSFFFKYPLLLFLFQTVYDANSSHVTYYPTSLTLVFFLYYFLEKEDSIVYLYTIWFIVHFLPPQNSANKNLFLKNPLTFRG